MLAAPLDQGLVLAADREHAGRVRREGRADDMLAVTSVAVRFVRVVKNGVVENIDQAPVIARDQEGAIGAELDLVNVSAVFARGMHSLHVPTQLHCRRCPNHLLAIRKAGGVMLLLCYVEVEFLVGATDSADIAGIGGPVEGCDERVVLGEGLVQRVGALVAD